MAPAAARARGAAAGRALTERALPEDALPGVILEDLAFTRDRALGAVLAAFFATGLDSFLAGCRPALAALR